MIPSSEPGSNPPSQRSMRRYHASGEQVITQPEVGLHLVQFHEDHGVLSETVCSYVAAGLVVGEPSIIIATKPHREVFVEQLQRSGIDTARAGESSLLTLLDAAETLASFMRHDVPDVALFKTHVGGVLRRVRGPRPQPARCYDEMVDLLWRAGNRDAAIQLEGLWSELAKTERFSLVCGYGMDTFRTGPDAADIQRVYSAQSHALPTDCVSRLDSEDARQREVAELQQRTHSLAAEVEHRALLEQSLREREAELRDFLEAAVEGIHSVDSDGLIVYANKAELDLLGYSRDEYIGHHIAEFHADRAVITDILARLSSGQSLENYEARLRCKDGSIKHVLINSNVLFRGGEFVHTRCFTRDITARKEKQSQAEQSLRFLAEASAILASSLEYDATLPSVTQLCVPTLADWAAVDMLMPEGSLTRLAVARAGPGQAGLARELAVGYPSNLEPTSLVEQVLRTGKPELISDLTQAGLGPSGTEPQLLALVRSLGLESAICCPLKAGTRVLGAITLGSAESGRRYTDRDLRLVEDLARRIGLAIENADYYHAAEQANQAKDEFLAVISHELRTPLNAILGWVHMLRERDMPEAQQARALETIERNARAQNQLIEDLLDVSRIVSGKLRLDVETVDLPQVLERAIETVRPAADAKHIQIRQTLDPSAGPVMGDPDRLQQVVWNLLSNAVKFTPKGAAIQVVLRKLDSSVEIIVRDSGQGIDPAFLPHVFERFRQADARISRVKGGLGLGLAIVRNLVELHGGGVRAESDGIGRGSVFTVCLPVSPLRAAASGRTPALHLMQASPRTHYPQECEGLNVLVVDDEQDARELLSALLVRCKMRVTTAASAAEALRLVPEQRPDVIISDVGMPEEDGYALIKKLRALPAEKGGRTPAVALTAYARTEERTKALVSGFNMHVPKPVEPSELLAVLASLASVFQAAN